MTRRRLRLLQAATVVLAAVGLFFAVIIALAVRDLYAQNQALDHHQMQTDYRLCQLTRLQGLDIRRLARHAGVVIHSTPLPPCVPPP